ncbi:replication initiation factor domain-containing protein [Leuconostoc suionicum]|uniref:replication initiation factor domain-containing protein n=1 Tax=Leuconostoc suionicum TaxID=1511761 RepID=UPI0024ACFC12|nr:replication initiation factor domain-containing protein [Leuconostoc suionicum]MDI6552085.1 replication initiation factor domain-containing protein [Leuconostoc suionicum]MDI6614958.1 replication initiation factor domain-containing protein [Leuconostoc suionicum]
MFSNLNSVSIDRIGITGNIEIPVNIQKLMSPLSSSGFRLGSSNHAGYCASLGKGRWRLDFNPNNVDSIEILLLFLRRMYNKKISRLDIAFDIYNDPNFFSYSYLQSGITQNIYSRSGKIQTIYYGSRKSDKLIRQYDKKAEQYNKGIKVDYPFWGRLEIQYRHRFVDEWFASTNKILNKFQYVDYSDLPYTERALIYSIQNHIVSWGELSAPTRLKYQKIISKKNNDISIKNELLKLLKSEQPTLKSQIDKYLM